jgi:integrase
MPRPTSDTPGYCLHRQSGRAYVTLDGHQRLLPGPHGSEESRGAYDRLIAEWLNAGRTLVGTPSTGPTVTMVALAFWKHAQAHYRHADGTHTSEVGNFREIIRPLRRLYGDTPAGDFGPKKLKALRSHLIADREGIDPKTGKPVMRPGWCRTYVNRQVKRVRLIFRWAASEEMIPSSVATHLETVDALRRGAAGARESAPVTGVPDAVVDATLPHLTPTVRALVKLQRLAGCRGGELLGLRTCDVDRSGPVWKYKPASHKTAHLGHERVVYFGPKAQEILGPLLKPDLAAYIFSPADADRERRAAQAAARKTPLSCGNRAGSNRKAEPKRRPGLRYTVESYCHAIYQACDRAFPPPGNLPRALKLIQKWKRTRGARQLPKALTTAPAPASSR